MQKGSHVLLIDQIKTWVEENIFPVLKEDGGPLASDSWDKIYVNKECEKTLRNYKDEEVAKDKETMDRVVNEEWKVNNELDDVVKYIREQLGV